MPTNIKRKIKKYEEIQPNHRMAFNMLYYHAGRTLCKMEQQIEKELEKSHRIKSATPSTAYNTNWNKWWQV